jgi:hypothetical protein
MFLGASSPTLRQNTDMNARKRSFGDMCGLGNLLGRADGRETTDAKASEESTGVEEGDGKTSHLEDSTEHEDPAEDHEGPLSTDGVADGSST